MISYYVILGKCLICRLLQLIKVGVKPATLSLFVGTLSDMARSRTDLIVENALLRQQLIFLNRHVKRPQLTQSWLLHSSIEFLLYCFWVNEIFLCILNGWNIYTSQDNYSSTSMRSTWT
jgi:hypothetical protein